MTTVSISNEKQNVALSSVAAALFLVASKTAVGLATGSLGILSEAAHSALDLGAALVTYFAVRISDKPADLDHTYGHGKIESFSALIETLLLLATCGWIIYEAVERLFFGKSIEVINTSWGIGVMVLSIVIDISRSRALKKVAEKYGSQALEADALHFSSDVWSSTVVIVGLMCVGIGDHYGILFLKYADPVAALGVSLLVIVVSIKLGKRTIDVLLDTAPKGMLEDIVSEVNKVEGVLEVAGVRVRPSGPKYFIDLNVGISKNESHRGVHTVVHGIRDRLRQKIPNSDVVISTFPIDIGSLQDREDYSTVKKIVDIFPQCTNIHNIHVYEVAGRKQIAVHIEVKESMALEESHDLSHKLGEMIQAAMPDVEDVTVTFEYVKQRHIQAEDITGQRTDVIHAITSLVNKVPDKLNCHEIKIYSSGDKLTIFLHCELRRNFTADKAEKISKHIAQRIQRTISNVESIHVHVEPMSQK